MNITAEVDRRLDEHIELLAMVRRLSYLLTSALLIINDPIARGIAKQAVAEAEALLAKVRKP